MRQRGVVLGKRVHNLWVDGLATAHCRLAVVHNVVGGLIVAVGPHMGGIDVVV